MEVAILLTLAAILLLWEVWNLKKKMILGQKNIFKNDKLLADSIEDMEYRFRVGIGKLEDRLEKKIKLATKPKKRKEKGVACTH